MPADQEPQQETPDGTAVFPLIPPELGVHPLLLGVLHAYVFFEGSEPAVVHPAAAEEAMHYLVTYLQRLAGPELRKVREDVHALVGFAKAEEWPREHVRFLHDFLPSNGVGTTRPAADEPDDEDGADE